MDDLDEVKDEEVGMDMDAALDDIAEGLGFATDPDNTPDDVLADDVVPTSTDTVDDAGSVPVEPETPADTPSSSPAPKTWRPEAAKTWETLPPEAKAEILKREEDMFKGIEGYKAEAAIGKVMKEVITPFLPELTQHGLDPVKHVQNLLNAHHYLSVGPPEQKLAIFQRLAQEYGVPIDGMAAGEAPYADPQIQQLNKTIDELRSRLDTTDNITATKVRESLKQEIDTFASDPKNVYFDEVANDIAHLLKTKAVTTLAEAYEKAVWMNPAVREKEIARQTTEKANLAKTEAAAKAAAAAKATAANVKTTPKQGRGTAPVGSMDDTLKETLAHIKSK